MTSKSKNPDDSSSPEQLLRDEIADLKTQLASAEKYIEFQKFRRLELSKMLKVGFWEWNEVEDRVLSYSHELAGVLGVDEAQLGKLVQDTATYSQIVHPDDLPGYLEHFSSSNRLEPGVWRYIDYRILVGQDEVRFIREYEQGVFDEADGLVTSFGMLQNITDGQVAVEALRQSEERFHSLFQQLPLGVQEEDYSAVKKVIDKLQFKGLDIEEYFLANPRVLREMVGQTRITNVNDALLRIHDADTREAFIAAEVDIDDWWDAQWVEYYAGEFAALASASKIYVAERVDYTVDGKYIETRSIVTLVKGYEDTWERVITIHEDITERKQGEAALVDALKQAESANRAKTDFLSNMSHELRTPLNAILGFAQLFTYDRGISEQQRKNAAEIERAGKHLMALIDQILDLTRIEAGETDLSLEPVALQGVLADCLSWIEPLAQARDITIDFDVQSISKIKVVADSIRLKQVFLNLLTNAIKYNRKGGRVEIICPENGAAAQRIGVRDTGIGISAEKLKELFQPFNRLGAEFSGVEGTGIGLVIARQLVDLMNGTLEIESESDVGSTFWVSLRRAPALAPVGATVTPVKAVNDGDQSSVRRARILVAEDNLINQELMAAQLDLLGYRADYAENGTEALQHWQSGNYGLLLTDIRMPEMNGYELVREIRDLEQDSGRRASVVAITANTMEADVEKCFAAGMDDVIAKPVELEALRGALDKWVPDDSADDTGTQARAQMDAAAAGSTALVEAIDFAVLAQATGNKPELHRSLLRSYRKAQAQAIDHLQQAFAWKNNEQIIEYSHKLKGSSASLGVTGVAQVCAALESAARQDKRADLKMLMPELRKHAEFAAESIREFLNVPPEVDETPAGPATADVVVEIYPDEEDITRFSLKVLLLDDDYIMHRVTSVMLNDLGVTGIINAMSGPEALEFLNVEEEPVDLIICDLNMPDMDGIEFIRHLAKSSYQGSLALTSGEDMRILKTVEKLAIEHDLHVTGVLEKPVTPARLGELLDSLDQIQKEGTVRPYDAITLVELEYAIHNDELDTWFQPKVDIATGRIVGVEALARWNHPEKGLIRPDVFIALAEEHQMISELTDAICHKAMEYAAKLKVMKHDLNIAINLSVDSLTDLGWPEKITAILDKFGLEASCISFEITESRLMEHLSVALDILGRLSLKRFNLSIDDFGTGYSSMEQLQRIPFSEFKIDRAFVHGAAREASALAILESSVLLAKKLDMTVVAEGVEDQQDWDTVAQAGCDQVQGYFVSRPLPFAQLVMWLDDPETQKKYSTQA